MAAPTKAASLSSQDELDHLEIGIIGMGDMGRLYANKFATAGYKQYVHHGRGVCEEWMPISLTLVPPFTLFDLFADQRQCVRSSRGLSAASRRAAG